MRMIRRTIGDMKIVWEIRRTTVWQIRQTISRENMVWVDLCDELRMFSTIDEERRTPDQATMK